MLKRFYVNKSQSLKDFIAQSLKISKNEAKEIIDSRNVLVNSKRVWIASHILKEGDMVEIIQSQPSSKDIIKIIYEDEFIIAVNKPPTLVSNIEKDSVEYILRKKFKNEKIKAIHRLDKETSGILLLAKDFNVYQRFKYIWDDKNIFKLYLAIVHNEATFKNLTINSEIDGKPAISHVKLLKKGNGFSYFQIRIETGRKHQIRKHLASIRHPIVGDKVYGVKRLESNLVKRVNRQMLHSYKLSFFHPYKNQKIDLTADIPTDFKNVANFLDF